jgi:hypothetical protein
MEVELYGYQIDNNNFGCNGLFSLGSPSPILIGDKIYEFLYFKSGSGFWDDVFYKGINCDNKWLSIDEIRNATRLVKHKH